MIVKYGAPLLLFAKFIPGVSAVAIPSAAAMGLPYRRFVLYDAAGALIWSGAYVGLGMIFSREVQRVLDALERYGGRGLMVVAVLFAIYIAGKLAYRWRLKKLFDA